MRVKELKLTKNLNVPDFMKITQSANQFESDIIIVGENFKVDAKSLMGLLTMIRRGVQITIITKGEDEEEAIKEIAKLLI